VKQQKQEGTDWLAPLQPLIDISKINFKAAQKFSELQSNFVSYLLDANLKQFETLVDSKDLKTVMEQQLKFFKAVDTKWCDAAEQEIEAARDVQQSISGVLEKNIHNSDFLEQLSTGPGKH
jgi:hypothetical protein